MSDEEARKLALELHLDGLSKVEIASRTGKSRQWVHKWIKRYESSPGEDWSRSLSRAPNTVWRKTGAGVEKLVLEVRDRLERTKYAQTGAAAIQYELAGLGLPGVPPTATIDRILKRNGRIRPARRQASQKKTIPTRISAPTRWTL